MSNQLFRSVWSFISNILFRGQSLTQKWSGKKLLSLPDFYHHWDILQDGVQVWGKGVWLSQSLLGEDELTSLGHSTLWLLCPLGNVSLLHLPCLCCWLLGWWVAFLTMSLEVSLKLMVLLAASAWVISTDTKDASEMGLGFHQDTALVTEVPYSYRNTHVRIYPPSQILSSF